MSGFIEGRSQWELTETTQGKSQYIFTNQRIRGANKYKKLIFYLKNLLSQILHK